MTVEVESAIAGPFSPNGATTAFPFDFKIRKLDEIEVLRVTTAGVVTAESPSLYVVTLADDGEGGTITYSVAPASSSDDLYIRAKPSFSQLASFSNSGFLPTNLNAPFDRAAARDLWLKDELSRALVAPVGTGDVTEYFKEALATEQEVDPSVAIVAANIGAINELLTHMDDVSDVATNLVPILRFYQDFGVIIARPEVWFDPSDLTSMKQDRGGGSASVTAAVGSPVGSWRNKGSRGGWATAPSDDARPTLRLVDGFYELEFDGVDDVLILPTPAIDLAVIEMYVGARLISNPETATGILTLAPSTGNDNNVYDGITFFMNYTAYGVGMQGGPGFLTSGGDGIINDVPHVYQMSRAGASAAGTMKIDNAPASPDIGGGAFTVQTGDLLIAARQGNGILGFGNLAIRSILIFNTPPADASSILTYVEGKTYGQPPQYPAIANTTELAAARATLISEIFGGGGLPTALATKAVESPHVLTGYATFTGLAQSEKMTIPGYAARPRLWTPSGTVRNDVIFLVCAGHSAGWEANGIPSVVMQPLFNAGVRVCTFVLPDGPNDYTSGGLSEHDAETSVIKWIAPIVIAINKLKTDFPSAAIHMTGISGGGWTTAMAAACDVRIVKSYQQVGSLPDYFYLNRDFEQRLVGLTADFLTLYLLAASPGRRHMQILSENDPVGFNRATFSTQPDYSVGLAALAAAIGGGDYDLNWINHNLHTYKAPEFANLVLSELPT